MHDYQKQSVTIQIKFDEDTNLSLAREQMEEVLTAFINSHFKPKIAGERKPVITGFKWREDASGGKMQVPSNEFGFDHKDWDREKLITHINRTSKFLCEVYQMLGGLRHDCFDPILWNMKKEQPNGWSDFSHKDRPKKNDWMNECISITDEANEWYQDEDEDNE